MSCLAHDGASYHESPISTSSLPSLFTSAIATPSDRNLPSITVFFHEMGVSLSPAWAEAIIRKIADKPSPAVFQIRAFIDRESLKRLPGARPCRPTGRPIPRTYSPAGFDTTG